jgi:hypothetical protein
MAEYEFGVKYPLTPSKVRDPKDQLPNGESFRSRVYQYYRERQSQNTIRGNMPRAYYIRMAKQVACPICNAEVDQPCTSISKKTPGMTLEDIHSQRYMLTKDQNSSG